MSTSLGTGGSTSTLFVVMGEEEDHGVRRMPSVAGYMSLNGASPAVTQDAPHRGHASR
jgi:hypothetical protein